MELTDSARVGPAAEFDFLRSHAVVETNDVDELQAVLARVYSAKSVVCLSNTAAFYARAANFQFETSSLSYCCYRGNVRIEFADDRYHRFQFAVAGSAQAVSCRSELDINPNVVVSAPGDAAFTFGSTFKQLVFRADKAQLEKDIGLLLGANPKNNISFAPITVVASGQAALLRKIILHSARMVDGTTEPIPARLLSELEQTLRMATLFGIPNNFSALITESPACTSLERVKRIEEWIDANWRESITLERLVEVSGVSGRSIFMAFKKMRGYSPMAYVKSCRLRAARELLLAGTPNATVTGIGYFCHFTNMSRFADDYRLQFGELPSRTLQRAKLAA